MTTSSQLVRSAPMIFVMGLIFWLSHQSGTDISLPNIANIDKLVHSMVYAVLAWSVILAIPAEKIDRWPGFTGIVVVLFCLLYGISDEFHQSFIPGRISSISDLAADFAGASLAVMIWGLWYRQQKSPVAVTKLNCRVE